MKINRRSCISLLIVALFSLSASPISYADGPNQYTSASNQTDFSAALGVDSAITIDASTVDVHNNVYTFSGFDLGISNNLVDNPTNYVITSSGVLLQANQ